MQLEKQQQLKKYYKKKIQNALKSQKYEGQRSNSPVDNDNAKQSLCQSLRLLEKLRNDDSTTATQQLSKQITEQSISMQDLAQTQKNMSIDFLIQENTKLKEALKELKELNAQLIAQLVQVNNSINE